MGSVNIAVSQGYVMTTYEKFCRFYAFTDFLLDGKIMYESVGVAREATLRDVQIRNTYIYLPVCSLVGVVLLIR